MEDYILREIDKIGKIIEALLLKMGVLKKSNSGESLYEATKIELLEKLDLDIDNLLEEDNFVDILIEEYEFNGDNLEKFAELLFDFVAASKDNPPRAKFITNITTIYKYLDKNGTSISINRYYILKELDKYI